MASNPAKKKAIEKAEAHRKIEGFTITITASEHNMQRLMTLLMFADRAEVIEAKPLADLPWDPRPDDIPVAGLQINYEAVRASIATNILKYVARHSLEEAKTLLASFGGEGLSKIPEQQLLGLNAALEGALVGPGAVE